MGYKEKLQPTKTDIKEDVSKTMPNYLTKLQSVSPDEQPKEEGVVSNVFRGITEPLATLAVRPYQAIKAIGGASPEEQDVTLPFYGKIKSPRTTEDLKSDVGRAVQVGMMALPTSKVVGSAKTLATTLGVSKKLAPTVAKIGAGAATGYGFDVGAKLEAGQGAESFKPGVGTAIGAAIPAIGIAKDAISKSVRSGAPRIVNSLIKPLKKDMSFGKNPGRAVAEEGIIANNMDDLLVKISDVKKTVGEKIGKKLSASTKKVDLSRLTDPIDEALKTAQNAPRTNAGLISRLEALRADLLGEVADASGNISLTRKLKNITANQAMEVKKLVGDLTKFTGNPSDDAMANKAMKKIYGLVKEKINRAVPGVSGLNERYADLLSAEVATKYRNEISQRLNIVGLSPTMTGIGGGIITAIATGGSALPSLLVGASAAGIDKLFQSTAFKTRLAAALAGKTALQRSAIIKAISEASPKLKEPLEKLILQQTTQKSNFGNK